MSVSRSSMSPVSLGVVPTHFRFVGGLVPHEDGCLPRNEAGEIVIVAGLRELRKQSPVAFDCVQVSLFPGTKPEEIDALVAGVKGLGLEVDFVLMVGGVNPMNPADEDAVIEQLLPNLQAAVRHGAKHVSSTSIEEWMGAEGRREGGDYEAAIAQNVKLHLRAYQEAGLESSTIEHWHIEFLRPGEFQTFTSLQRGWECVHAINKELGRPFFQVLVDAAHCADSGVLLEENEKLIHRIADAGEFGIFHASAKTTRGCLGEDGGWIEALMSAAACAGSLKSVYVEVFDHEDPALEPLRQVDPGHGVDTTHGRTYNQVVSDGLVWVCAQLDRLGERGNL